VSAQPELVRPDRVVEVEPPPMPQPDESDAETASTAFSKYRTKLSRHRTGLSEHRTQLSEHRTDLSTHRTRLSTNRTELSMRRTGMSFQRTRLSAERTLMSVIRTALSLIGFGFTIYQVFRKMVEAKMVTDLGPARYFGVTLLVLGVLLLVGGVFYHLAFMQGLRAQRSSLHAAGLVHAESGFPVSLTLLTALLLLATGLFCLVSIMFRIGPLA
jgi:uncharacterized membrane protein YidH (DUF202 family)